MGQLYPWRQRRLKGLEEFDAGPLRWRCKNRDSRPGNRSQLAIIVAGLLIGGGLGSFLAFGDPATFFASARSRSLAMYDALPELRLPVYFRYCADARRAGAAPLYRGDPGYAERLDADGDGVACEPYPADDETVGRYRRRRH